jgi:hypothetical protein
MTSSKAANPSLPAGCRCESVGVILGLVGDVEEATPKLVGLGCWLLGARGREVMIYCAWRGRGGGPPGAIALHCHAEGVLGGRVGA